MIGLHSLWLPILLSGVAVFLASSVIHMALPWHKGDYRKLPDEEKVRAALGPLAIPPGDYMVPRAGGMEEMKSPEFKKKFNDGPVMVCTVMPSGSWGMGRAMSMWFVYCLVVAALAAYVTGRALPFGAHYLKVFRFAGATTFIAFSGALAQMSIWYRRSWRTTIVSSIDGLIYAGLTAGIFGWLWPR
jgi:hypothetical protein